MGDRGTSTAETDTTMTGDETMDDDTQLIKRAELLKMVPYTIQHIYRLEKAGTFPKRVKLGAHKVVWVRAEVVAWLRARMKERETVVG